MTIIDHGLGDPLYGRDVIIFDATSQRVGQHLFSEVTQEELLALQKVRAMYL